ncbi:hypothetical protein JYU34_001864 [Plutella xylostella]|uniref:Reverse transcriptase domain-containing protein n=1 Tax=Plutella xylostella TaxID=51655 RepID=A0ABQ7R527_PLUXY|nr:hypothetical protein JYU34_001864 [Plutella xylostella]
MGRCFHNCRFLMFADDLKIFRTVTCQEDCELIQQDLDRFYAYCLNNKLHLAHEKCMQISFTRNKNKIIFQYNIGGKLINRVTSIRDLGILLDDKLILDQHVENITCRAYKMMGFVLRSAKPFKNASTYLLLYKTLVRPCLEYASVIWNPLYAVYIKQIEMIQKKFLRALHYRMAGCRMSYVNLLELYNIPTLENRRILSDAISLYCICRGEYNCPDLLSSIKFRVPSIRTRSQSLFSVPSCASNAGIRAPLRRICDTYNKRLLSVDLFCNSRNQFKTNVLNILSSSE